MRTPATTVMSGKGQVVIPASIRQYLRLEPGTPFIVLGRGDTLVLHRLKEPPWKAFDELTTQVQKQGLYMDEAMATVRKVANKLRSVR